MSAVEQQHGQRTLRGILVFLGSCVMASSCNTILDNGTAQLASPADSGGTSSSGSASGSSGTSEPDASSSSSSSSSTSSSSSSGSVTDGGSSSGGVRAELVQGSVREVAATDSGLFKRTLTDRLVFQALGSATDVELPLRAEPDAGVLPAFGVSAPFPTAEAPARAFAVAQSGDVFECTSSECTKLPYIGSPQSLTAANGGVLMFSEPSDAETNLLFATSVEAPLELTPTARAPLLAASSTRYFFTQDAVSISQGLYADNTDDTTVVPVDNSLEQTISAIAANDRFVILAGRCGDNLICKIDLTVPGPVYAVEGVHKLPSGMEEPTILRLFADDDILYWTARKAGLSSTWRCDLGTNCNATATEIAAGAAESFSRNTTDVYFVASEQLYRIPRALVAP